MITFLNTHEFFPELYTTYQWSNQVSTIVYCLHMRMNLIDDLALKSDTWPFVAYHNDWNWDFCHQLDCDYSPTSRATYDVEIDLWNYFSTTIYYWHSINRNCTSNHNYFCYCSLKTIVVTFVARMCVNYY